MEKDIKDLKVLFDSNTLKNRIKEVAHHINSDYDNKQPITLVCVLNGAVMFFTELAKHLQMPLEMEFVKVSSYGNEKVSSGKLNKTYFDIDKFKEKDIIIVEDIIDSGLTLYKLSQEIKTVAKSVKIAVLLDKTIARKHHLDVDYSCFEIDDKFVVGFGLDYNQFYRNIDYIGYFE